MIYDSWAASGATDKIASGIAGQIAGGVVGGIAGGRPVSRA